MSEINKPMGIPELNLSPPVSGKVRLSEDMQQTLALLSGYGVSQRKLLRCSEAGVLNVASARVKDIMHVTASGDNDTYQGENVDCTEVMIMGHPDNAGNVWARTDVTATTDNAWPLAAFDVIKFTVNNLKELQLLIEKDTEKAIVLYTM